MWSLSAFTHHSWRVQVWSHLSSPAVSSRGKILPLKPHHTCRARRTVGRMRQLWVSCLRHWGCNIQTEEPHGAPDAGNLKACRLCAQSGPSAPSLCPTPTTAHQPIVTLAKASLAAPHPNPSVVSYREASIKYQAYDQKKQKQEKPQGRESEQLTPGFNLLTLPLWGQPGSARP